MGRAVGRGNGDGGGGGAYRGDVVGLSAVFKQQCDDVCVALLRRLVEGSVTHLHTVVDLFFIDPFITDLQSIDQFIINLKNTLYLPPTHSYIHPSKNKSTDQELEVKGLEHECLYIRGNR